VHGPATAVLADRYAGTPDLALELPTGTGKTLLALVIADWSRRVRVVYACPTQQLARQVLATAHREGVPAVLLVGSHHGWSVPADGHLLHHRRAGVRRQALNALVKRLEGTALLALLDSYPTRRKSYYYDVVSRLDWFLFADPGGLADATDLLPPDS
jgi:Rad3-related DNA helicase